MKTPNKSGIKGVFKITSNNGANVYWMGKVGGRINIGKRFPFTERGKELAEIFRNKVIEENRDKYYQYQKQKK
jgi:hypothetical protein